MYFIIVSMDKLFQIEHTFTDRNGIRIFWYKNGYKEVLIDHPEVGSHFELVCKAIENPDSIYQDVDNINRVCNYLHNSGGYKYQNKHMKVVLESAYGIIRVITAYFCLNIKEKQENLIWKKV